MYTQISRNKRLSIVLVVLFVVLISALGGLVSLALGRPSLIILAVVFAVVYAVVGYYASAKIAIAMSGAREVEKSQAPELYRVVENLSIAAGLPTPKVYIIDDPSPNAFATGRDPQNAYVAVTSGLLQIMDQTELEGVLAHELSHVGNYDIRFMAVVAAMVSVVGTLADWFLWTSFLDDEGENTMFRALAIVGSILAPLVAVVVQLAVSRQREYLADSSGALLTRYPDGLASALAKIEQYGKPLQRANTSTAHLYISNPLRGRSLAGLFDTHPPIEERIKRLNEMGRSQ